MERPSDSTTGNTTTADTGAGRADSSQRLLLIVAWLWAGIPLAWGVYNTIQKSLPLFRG